eukprot:CAMPEP_0114524646 /NCGR_PEP_ID=MMETSP0109-20121206/21973_1 /TAXON_ID=29199 /ORGANISM="Chlorarachnion reptans, Strain CCCM449" /LENGTH=106 /DNA_ID=CAMNT_0001706117 /DNA_START=346 /DNA_END=664 /DNA_ORIENTATION=-
MQRASPAAFAHEVILVLVVLSLGMSALAPAAEGEDSAEGPAYWKLAVGEGSNECDTPVGVDVKQGGAPPNGSEGRNDTDEGAEPFGAQGEEAGDNFTRRRGDDRTP